MITKELLGEELQTLSPRDTNLTGRNESSNPTVDFLLKKIKSPKNRLRIDKAIELEKRIRLHTVGTQDSSTHFDEWLRKIKLLLPVEKYEVFIQLIGEPVSTLDLTETIFDELAKIFEASNSSIHLSYNTGGKTKENKFNQFFDHKHFFKNEVYDMFKVAPNSVLVVDTKLELNPLTGQVQPIAYFVHLDSILDLDVNRDGSTNYIIYQVDKNKIVAVDKTNYYVFEREQGGEYLISPNYPSPHNLTDELDRPYTPAFLIYPDFLNVTDNIVVNSPLTKSLGNLDWLLFWSTSKRYLDLYAPFPIYVSYEQDCRYEHPTGATCNAGFINIESDTDLEAQTIQIPCPHCAKTKMFGAGSEVTVPAPQSKEDPNLIDAIKVIPAEEKSITYVTSEEQRLEQKIYYSVLGKTSTPLESFSQSVSQLDLSTESRKAVLIHVKSLFEKVHHKVLYTMNKLIWGEEFLGCYVNYGDNYFLSTQKEEIERYKTLKEAGAPESMLHAGLEGIISTTYKTSPHISLLQQVYLEVEPYQTMSIESVMKLTQQGLIPRNAAIAKLHFTDFIENFESDHEALITAIQSGGGEKANLVKQLKADLTVFATEKQILIDADRQKEVDFQQKSMVALQPKTSPDLTKPSSMEKRTDRSNAKDKGNEY